MCTGGIDYVSGIYTVTFPAGTQRVPFEIPIADDGTYEGNEDFTLTIDLSSLPDSVTRGNPGSATVTIVDDESKWLMIIDIMKMHIYFMFDWRPFQITHWKL